MFEIGRVTELWRQFRLRDNIPPNIFDENESICHCAMCVHRRTDRHQNHHCHNLKRIWIESLDVNGDWDWVVVSSELNFFLGRMQIFDPSNLVQVSESKKRIFVIRNRHFFLLESLKLWFVYLFICGVALPTINSIPEEWKMFVNEFAPSTDSGFLIIIYPAVLPRCVTVFISFHHSFHQ